MTLVHQRISKIFLGNYKRLTRMRKSIGIKKGRILMLGVFKAPKTNAVV